MFVGGFDMGMFGSWEFERENNDDDDGEDGFGEDDRHKEDCICIWICRVVVGVVMVVCLLVGERELELK